MVYSVLSVLIVTVIVLSVKLILIKREIRKTSVRLSEDDSRTILTDGVDKDLDTLVAGINRLYDKTLAIRNASLRSEKELKSSISMISHDMKTPLTSIIGYLQLAARDEKNQGDPNIEIALERSLYLNSLVNDFFEISVIDSGKLETVSETFNICETICEEIFALAPEFDKRGIIPKFKNSDDDVRIQADKRMFTRIVQNLLSNSIKYSEGRLELKVNQTGDETIFEVITKCTRRLDTDRMFDKFYREDEARSGDGAGLGMYIVRRFADGMNSHAEAMQDKDLLTIRLTIPNKH